MNWNIRELKSNAKGIVKRNYIQFIIVCIVIAFVAGGYSTAKFNTALLQETSIIKTPSIVNSAAKILDNLGVTELYENEEDIINQGFFCNHYQ